MRCPSCGYQNPEGMKFCGECGASLQRAALCSSCGFSNPSEVKFCHECGQSLGGTSAPRTPTPAPALPASFAGGRYQVQRFLGEGAKKRVYLAHDSKLDSDVAIALIKTDGLDAEGLTRVRREAQAMGQLRDNPYIVTVLDIGDEAGQPYIVMEHMQGGPLDGRLQQTDGDGLALEQALRIGGQVAQALEHAHSRGIIHRDLKPGNVWLTQDGTAKLGDFGFALAADRSRLTQAGMMVGTPYCMPPEQALGGEVTAASDLYSLGCVLYEMVAGRPPFPGDDPTAVISQHINTAPVAPSWYTDHCPPDLEELILKLLAKAPADRPQAASEVREALERIDPNEKSASHTEANVLDRLARGVFVGREKELDGLRKAFDEAFAGRGSIVMLVGEPGIGKTRSAQELETYARMRGAQVLWGLSHEAAGAPAYWPWIQAGRMYAATRDITDLAEDMQGTGPELVRIFPELPQLANVDQPEDVSDPEAAQFRLFAAYTNFVRAMSIRAPILIALDDLHWTDKASLLLLQHLARELSRMRVLIVCTYRDTDLVRTHPLSEALASLNRESGFQRIVLRGLSREEVAGYIRSVANVVPAPSVLDKIFEETEGNPFFLSEVVNLMAQEGTLTKESVSDIAIPDGVREALGRRLNRISEEANELLQIAAVVGSEFTYDTLTLMEERDEEELLRLIEEALEARVIEEMDRPGRYRFTHAQMQETLLAELSTTRRVRLQGRVGEALEKRFGDRADELAARLARHFVEAAMLTQRHAQKAVRYSKLAAVQAEAQAAWDVAARHYEHCLTLVTEAEDKLGEDEPALLTALGICARNTGDYRTAWRSLMRARTLYQERGEPAGLAQATLEALLILAPPQRHFALIQEALAELGNAEPHLEARLLAYLILPAYPGHLEPAKLERAKARIAELVEAYGFEDVQAAILLADGREALISGRLEDSVQLLREVYERFAELGHPGEAADALSRVSTAIILGGDLGRAEETAQELLVYSRAHHIRFWEEGAAGFIAGILLARCDFAAFDALAEERASDVGYPIHAYRVTRAEMAGEIERAVALLPDPAVAGGNATFTSHIHAIRARVLLNAGQEAQARDEFQRMREMAQLTPGADVLDGVAIHPPVNGFLGEALPVLADESYQRATEASAKRDVYREFIFSPFTLDSIPRLNGEILLIRGRIDDAEQQFTRGLEACERERCPVEAGRCLQGLAEVAERRGNTSEALQLLDRAAALFQEHGAKLYLNRVIAKKVKLQGITSGSIMTSIDAVAAIVQSEQPALPAKAVAPDGTVTLLFTDIEGSTPLNERLGDQRWMQLLRAHNALVREELRSHDAFEVKTEGDGFMVAFGSARKALQCAIAIQRSFAAHDWGDQVKEGSIRVRIGLHTGEMIQDAGDFYGKHVNLASRIANEAQGGEILVSSLLRELTESAGDIAFGKERKLTLKGLSGSQGVFSVRWE